MFQANGWVSWKADSDLLGVQLDFPLPNYFEMYAMKHYLKIRRKKKSIGEEEFCTQNWKTILKQTPLLYMFSESYC